LESHQRRIENGISSVSEEKPCHGNEEKGNKNHQPGHGQAIFPEKTPVLLK